MTVSKGLAQAVSGLTYRFLGLKNNQYHENAKKYLRGGFGGVMAFGPKGGDVASKMLLNHVRVISHQTKCVTGSYLKDWI